VVIATTGLNQEEVRRSLRPDHIVIDLVNLEKARRLDTAARYEGICW